MKKLLIILMVFPLFVIAQKDSVLSGVYQWKESSILLEGKVHDFEWMQISTHTLKNKARSDWQKVPVDLEYLLIIRSGKMVIGLNDSAHILGPGSTTLLMPGQHFSILTQNAEPVTYYLFKYRSKQPANLRRGLQYGGSLVKNWDSIVFKPHDKGGIRNYFERATAMCKRLEIHVTTLKEAIKSHEPHTHRAEEIVLMIEGSTEMQIGKDFYKGRSGDLYYLGSNMLHAIRNEGTKPCMYFAIQFD